MNGYPVLFGRSRVLEMASLLGSLPVLSQGAQERDPCCLQATDLEPALPDQQLHLPIETAETLPNTLVSFQHNRIRGQEQPGPSVYRPLRTTRLQASRSTCVAGAGPPRA
jgi:hypothetical protein